MKPSTTNPSWFLLIPLLLLATSVLAQKTNPAELEDRLGDAAYFSVGYTVKGFYSSGLERFLLSKNINPGSGIQQGIGVNLELYLSESKRWLIAEEFYTSLGSRWGDLRFNQWSFAMGGGYKIWSKERFSLTPYLLVDRQEVNPFSLDDANIHDFVLWGGQLKTKANWFFSNSKRKLGLSLGYGVYRVAQNKRLPNLNDVVPKGTLFHGWQIGLCFGGNLSSFLPGNVFED